MPKANLLNRYQGIEAIEICKLCFYNLSKYSNYTKYLSTSSKIKNPIETEDQIKAQKSIYIKACECINM